MLSVSIALPSTLSGVLSLAGLDTSGPITFGLSSNQTSEDRFVLYGTLDSAATDTANAFNLGAFSGGSANLPANIAEQAKTWPYLLVQRTGGSTAGTFYATGDAADNPAVVSVAAPSGTGFSSVINMTAFGVSGIRIGGSRQMTASDVVDVYLSQDPSISDSTGCYKAGRIVGGGGTALNSILTIGWPYAIVQRVSGTTAGNILAAGVASSTGGSLPPVLVLADLPTTAAAGVTCWVVRRQSMYVFDGSSWQRTLVTDPGFATLLNVYVNSSTGNDDAIGTISDPIQTVGEVIARLGINPISTSSFGMTINAQAAVTESNLDFGTVDCGEQNLTLWQDPADVPVALQTTVAASTAWNVPANVVGTIRGTASLVPHVGKIFEIIGGARGGAVGYLRSDEGGGNIEFLCQAALWTPGFVTPQAGDVIRVYDLVSGPDTISIGSANDIFFAYLNMFSGAHAVTLHHGGLAWFSGCTLGGGVDSAPGGFVSVIACGAPGANGSVRAEGQGAMAEVYGSDIHGFVARTLGQVNFGDVILEERCGADSFSIILNNRGFLWTEDAATGTIIDIGTRSLLESAGQIGGRNANGGTVGTMLIRSGGSYYGATPTIAGVGWQIGAGGIQKTWADVPAGYTNPANGATFGLRS